MNLKNILFGTAFTALLVVGLGATRLMKVEEPVDELELMEIQPISLTPPPEPPEVEPNQELTETAPPPPSFADLRPNLSIETLALPSADQPVSPDVEVDLFAEDLTPAELPSPVKAKPKPKVTRAKSTPKAKPQKTKTSIGVDDLDSTPRVVRLGRFRWPSSVRDNQVRAKVIVEIGTDGSVKLLRVQSVSHPAFKSMLSNLVHGCRFSIPKYKGKSVKVAYAWNLILQKP
ncbi:hypothetical protein ACFPK9_02285 [Rubritalea spongiae]|uniref:TonB C-terminal domain-containing protein n=1 Tax=Rubritalea spongiae TaxID=430797 RepID=A0ABW5E6J5_9BACT